MKNWSQVKFEKKNKTFFISNVRSFHWNKCLSIFQNIKSGKEDKIAGKNVVVGCIRWQKSWHLIRNFRKKNVWFLHWINHRTKIPWQKWLSIYGQRTRSQRIPRTRFAHLKCDKSIQLKTIWIFISLHCEQWSNVFDLNKVIDFLSEMNWHIYIVYVSID